MFVYGVGLWREEEMDGIGELDLIAKFVKSQTYLESLIVDRTVYVLSKFERVNEYGGSLMNYCLCHSSTLKKPQYAQNKVFARERRVV